MTSLLTFLFISLFTPLAIAQSSGWEGYIDSSLFSDAEALGNDWSLDNEYVDGRERLPEMIKQKALACKKTNLWATHPQQTTKDYLFAVWNYYDHSKIPAQSSICLTPNPARKYCLRADIAKFIIMSDTYTDECGNLYRGYWIVSFLATHENMGTLVSKGRTFYTDSDGSNFRLGHTYPVKNSEFLFLAELLPGDEKLMEVQKDLALKEGMLREGFSFKPRN